MPTSPPLRVGIVPYLNMLPLVAGMEELRGEEPGPRSVCVLSAAPSRMVSLMEAGELVAIMNAGAYGFSMASNYNSRPLAAEVLCTDGEARLIRQREPMADLWRHERDEAIDFEQPGL
ncbi:hypothetical protein IIC65_04065 [Candidatus Sumerlaeota bacterium]|nr:hypothetical protein [Candidatus Sumerlaeota bacterium]